MFKQYLESFLDLVYPRKCPGCKLPRDGEFVHGSVCSECWAEIEMTAPPFCRLSGRPKPFFDRAYSVCVYSGVMQELIHEFKYRGKDYLGRPLSTLLTGFIRDYDIPVAGYQAVIPMPLHRARLREREFNQSEILSREVAAGFGLPLADKTLVRTRNTPMQSQLPEEKRQKNIAGSFGVRDPQAIRGKSILLIDDVLTTGATASEAARTLKAAGAGSVTVMTLAS